jgi:hypothetical protein
MPMVQALVLDPAERPSLRVADAEVAILLKAREPATRREIIGKGVLGDKRLWVAPVNHHLAVVVPAAQSGQVGAREGAQGDARSVNHA